MTRLLNRPSIKELRSKLRHNLTNSERKLWNCIRNKQVLDLRFHRQYSIGNYIVDFYCPKHKLAIELDGGQHNNLSNQQYDERRTNYLKSLGIKTIRFWDNEVLQNTEGVVESIVSSINPS